MKKHVDLVANLFVVWGSLGLLASLGVLVLGFGLGALVVSSDPGQAGARVMGGLVTGLTSVLAVLGLVGSAGHLWNASGLRKRRDRARLVGLVLAVLDVSVLPFGPALGVYAFWVLTHRDVRAEFEPPA